MDLSALLWPYKSSINVFGIEIYAYALIIVCGMAAAFFVISTLFKRRNMSSDLFLTFFVIGLPIAILTTRLFYCITSGMHISQWLNFASIREGGLSIIGGIIGGTASVAITAYVKKVNFLRVGDCVVVGLLLAQGIGRWGNFVNQEVYGGLVESESLQWFPLSVFINDVDAYGNAIAGQGEWHYAFFFYESVINITAAVLMFINAWKNGKKPNGVNSACYFIVYGLTRSIMEPLRDESFILSGGGVPWSFVMSLLMLFGGIVFLFVVLYLNKKKEGAVIGSVNGDPYGITRFLGDTKDEVAYFSKINMMCAIYPENYREKKDDRKKKSDGASSAETNATNADTQKDSSEKGDEK